MGQEGTKTQRHEKGLIFCQEKAQNAQKEQKNDQKVLFYHINNTVLQAVEDGGQRVGEFMVDKDLALVHFGIEVLAGKHHSSQIKKSISAQERNLLFHLLKS